RSLTSKLEDGLPDLPAVPPGALAVAQPFEMKEGALDELLERSSLLIRTDVSHRPSLLCRHGTAKAECLGTASLWEAVRAQREPVQAVQRAAHHLDLLTTRRSPKPAQRCPRRVATVNQLRD